MTAVTAVQHKITHFFNNITWYRYPYSVSVSVQVRSICAIWYWSQPDFNGQWVVEVQMHYRAKFY